MKINNSSCIPDTHIQTQYELLPGFWHPYDVFLHKKNQFEHKTWGFAQTLLWRQRSTALCIASCEFHAEPVTCPRLQLSRYLCKQKPAPEIAAIYYHHKAWHVCIYAHGLVMRHLSYEYPQENAEGLLSAWALMVQQYPKAGVLPIICTQAQTVQMLRANCHNPVTQFRFTL